MTTIFSSRRRLLVLGAVGGAALVAGRLVSVKDGEVAQFVGATMGTQYTVKVAQSSALNLQAAASAVQQAFDAVDHGMSIFRADSEVSRFNRAAAGAVPVTTDLMTVLAMAQRVARWSDGAFDVTVKPLVQSWGFGTDKRARLPDDGRLQSARAAVGWRALTLEPQTSVAIKAHDTLQIDLGGIAKGYGVDQGAAALERLGVRNYMIEVGGEVRTAGVNGAGNPWQIGIEEPDAAPQRARHVVGLSGQSMATSGDYRIFFERDGRRYSHEIDPARGAPIEHGLASVSVVADDAMQADALATALIVLGPDRGYALAQGAGVAAHFIVRDKAGTLLDRSTGAFAALTSRPV